jgi:hypothetical protein
MPHEPQVTAIIESFENDEVEETTAYQRALYHFSVQLPALPCWCSFSWAAVIGHVMLSARDHSMPPDGRSSEPMRAHAKQNTGIFDRFRFLH